eukprot:TRINITY_DN2152_c0_g1_i1.p1 TRINITY_DN2152_c0_g1~~TRINITY_DN2152_c0_g1_i1.p1  ORF type:complete len:309 (-),score=43.28 TRINITY_DN2152_c0_g1_i1:92-976(-)
MKIERSLNPWLFSERSSVWDILVNSTSLPLIGFSDQGSTWWGFYLQFVWQRNSGRLFMTGDEVSPYSWWAGVNYFLTICPYLAAMKVGLTDQVEIIPPNYNAEKFCLTYDECNVEVMGRWFDVMNTIKLVQMGKLNVTLDDLITLIYKGHTETILAALPVLVDELSLLSDQERRFGHGWALFVEIIAATNFDTNYTDTQANQKYLPTRVLTNKDIPPFIFDMPEQTNILVATIITVHEMDELGTFQTLLDAWKSEMKNPKCRADGREFLESFLDSPFTSIFKGMLEIIDSCNYP